jgi:hypothetical protein
MKRLLGFALAVAAGFAGVGPSLAQAQFPAQQINPQLGMPPPGLNPGAAVSPYLNLLRRETIPGINYYGIVRPQVEFGNSILQLQEQGLLTRQEVNSEAERFAPTTGHPVQFQNAGRYFQTLNRQTTANALNATPATTFKPKAQLPPTGAPSGYPVPIR